MVAPECSAVAVRGFRKRYRRREVVHGVDLCVPRHGIYGLIGPDGAGKSSLMKAVAGVLSYEGGSVEVFGQPVDSERHAERIKPRLGFMPQGLGLNLYPELSVEENVEFFARLREVPPEARARRKERLLAMTRLDRFRDRAMKHLSGGMKQKLGLVCSLIHEPELVILDEPTTGVDPVSRRDFWAILTELLGEKGITALISTAYMDEASRFHALAMLHEGRVLASGSPEQILQAFPGTVVEVEVRPQLAAHERLRAAFPITETVGPQVRVFVPEADAETATARVRARLAGLELRSVRTDEPDLETAFVALLQRGAPETPAAHTPPEGAPPAQAPDERGQPDPEPQRPEAIAIEARGLVRDFGRFRAVDHVSFRVRRGEIFGLLGANGAGKTTVIKMLTGILPPTDGEGRVAGADPRRAGRIIKDRIGYVSQAFSLYRELTVAENLRLYAGIYGLANRRARPRIAAVTALAGLAGREHEIAGALPMGVRQRLALACALVHEPQVLFLDEPTSGVDPLGRRRFWQILLRLSREQGVTVLVTTHYMSEAEHCDHLALMYAGRIVADASPAELKSQLVEEAGQLLELQCQRPLEAARLLERAGYPGVSLHGTRIHLFARDLDQARADVQRLLAAHGIRVLSLRPRTPTMEDVFVHRIVSLERAERHSG